MEINVPFSQFYAAELQAAFDRSGRPDETFFARCASVPGINAKYYARIGGNDANTLARIEGAPDIEECGFSHPKIKSHFVRYYSYTAYNFHFMEVHARSHEKLRDHPELIAQAEEAAHLTPQNLNALPEQLGLINRGVLKLRALIPGTLTARAFRARAKARRAPAGPSSRASLPKPIRGPSGPPNTICSPRPCSLVDFGSSTPLQGMFDV